MGFWGEAVAWVVAVVEMRHPLEETGVRAASVAAEKETVAVTEVAAVALDAARRDFWEDAGALAAVAGCSMCLLFPLRRQISSSCEHK